MPGKQSRPPRRSGGVHPPEPQRRTDWPGRASVNVRQTIQAHRLTCWDAADVATSQCSKAPISERATRATLSINGAPSLGCHTTMCAEDGNDAGSHHAQKLD